MNTAATAPLSSLITFLAAGWTRDRAAFDPMNMVRQFEIDGRVFVARIVRPGAHAMTIREIGNLRGGGTVARDDWDAAVRAARTAR